jgi:hypothetical protein
VSKIALVGNASGTGTFTLASPNSSTDRTLDLPDASGVIDRLNRAGNVLQVVSTDTSTSTSITSTSYVDTNCTATITPTSASSKILVIASLDADLIRNSNVVNDAYANLVRNSTELTDKYFLYGSGTSSNGFVYFPAKFSIVYLDTPATTSATTYKVQAKVVSNASAAAFRFSIGAEGFSNMTLMEIAA